MNIPYIGTDCGDSVCKDCVLNGALCERFETIVEQLNDIISTIAKTPEKPKPHPQFNRGDKVQVSDDRITWQNRYFERIREDGMILVTRAMEDSFSGFSGTVSTTYKYCRPCKDE
jgi:hypothetical protein